MAGERKGKEKQSVLNDKDRFEHSDAERELRHMGDETTMTKQSTGKSSSFQM